MESPNKAEKERPGNKRKMRFVPYTYRLVPPPSREDDCAEPRAAPRAARTQSSNGSELGLSRRRIQELADWYSDQGHRRHNAGTLDTAALDAELRAILREEVAFPEHVEIEFERVMKAVFSEIA
jgi:hypothetical protein